MALYRCSDGNYSGGNYKAGTFTVSGATDYTITLGFKPKFVAILFQGANGSTSDAAAGAQRYIYDEDYSASYFYRALKDSDGVSCYINQRTLGNANGFNVTNTGFVFNPLTSDTLFRGTYQYFAIG